MKCRGHLHIIDDKGKEKVVPCEKELKWSAFNKEKNEEYYIYHREGCSKHKDIQGFPTSREEST